MGENYFEKLGKEIYELYTKDTFSKVLKSEIDIIVFHTFLMKNLDDNKISETGTICYEEIDKNDIYNLSLISGLKEAIIQSKIESDFYKFRDKKSKSFSLKVFIETQLSKTQSGPSEYIKEGKIRLFVANPVVKKQVINALVNQGSVPDFSFNKDIISIGLPDVLEILYGNNDSVKESLYDAIQKNYPDTDKKQIEPQKSENSTKTICMNILKYMGKTAYEKCLEAAFTALFSMKN